MDTEASESKFKAHYHDRVVCLNSMHTACSSMYFVRAAQKQEYAIQNALML